MTVNWNGDSPIYIQLYQQVITRILDGHIKEGEALPSVRKVAAEYQLNPLTISKAYQMLQDEHYVEKQRGKGLFVKFGAPKSILIKQRSSFLSSEWPLILQKISRLQLSIDELPRTTKEAQ
ncbi:GntR family transcriptional regulator [uncultured Paraglaciecola sp.]|uniref:GntR family transcriptional regulator n=1 Tax=uncultured Paraglaciecola sp. TaxID=1765024 RepID=UPI0026230469|nr:GntR family transcriptional regulator [uncultured Paraglaciecola sp.]